MNDTYDDNRFELIEKYKKKLIEATNIKTSTEEMKVLDNILFRFWQMGWLDKLDLLSARPERRPGEWIYDGDCYICTQCKSAFNWWADSQTSNFCPNCGADMRGGAE